MTSFSPISWAPYLPWLGILYLAREGFVRRSTSAILPTALGLLFIKVLSGKWSDVVTENVYPYMDEIFHIPQAQAYCAGDFHIWDPKLTTPPGLYVLSTLLGNVLTRSCNVSVLRSSNTYFLTLLLAYAASCRAQIYHMINRKWEVIHTAVNIALFPPLFFFSGLYYTDVLSTCVVVLMYKLWLENSPGIVLYIVGVFALTLRQTNIFWVAIFLGGLEAIRTFKAFQTSQKEALKSTWKGTVESALNSYAHGQIHDIPLRDAQFHDFLLIGVSTGVAIAFSPLLILRRTWPFIALLISFAGFVFWNGGVVLGDKSNHVATIHTTQLLYLWALIAFFSFPLLLPAAFSVLRSTVRLITKPPRTNESIRNLVVQLFTLIISLMFTLAAIYTNTLVHPFTLSDNRHYMFYVFRYTILIHPLAKFCLAPIYLLAFYLCFYTLAGATSTITTISGNDSSNAYFRALALQKFAPETPTEDQIQKSIFIMRSSGNFSPPTTTSLAPQHSSKDPAAESAPSLSFFVFWGLTTALSLITAPLVEPRYFIIPWVLWRLHIPPAPLSIGNDKIRKKRREGALRKVWGGMKKMGWEKYDGRLWLETGWFLVINAVTGYVFLERGFEWASEAGVVQRFMW